MLAAFSNSVFETAGRSVFASWAVFARFANVDGSALVSAWSLNSFARSSFEVTNRFVAFVSESFFGSPSNTVQIFEARLRTFFGLLEGVDASEFVVTAVFGTRFLVVANTGLSFTVVLSFLFNVSLAHSSFTSISGDTRLFAFGTSFEHSFADFTAPGLFVTNSGLALLSQFLRSCPFKTVSGHFAISCAFVGFLEGEDTSFLWITGIFSASLFVIAADGQSLTFKFLGFSIKDTSSFFTFVSWLTFFFTFGDRANFRIFTASVVDNHDSTASSSDITDSFLAFGWEFVVLFVLNTVLSLDTRTIAFFGLLEGVDTSSFWIARIFGTFLSIITFFSFKLADEFCISVITADGLKARVGVWTFLLAHFFVRDTVSLHFQSTSSGLFVTISSFTVLCSFLLDSISNAFCVFFTFLRAFVGLNEFVDTQSGFDITRIFSAFLSVVTFGCDGLADNLFVLFDTLLQFTWVVGWASSFADFFWDTSLVITIDHFACTELFITNSLFTLSFQSLGQSIAVFVNRALSSWRALSGNFVGVDTSRVDVTAIFGTFFFVITNSRGVFARVLVSFFVIDTCRGFTSGSWKAGLDTFFFVGALWRADLLGDTFSTGQITEIGKAFVSFF
jgi:hypothetical protein